MHDSFDFVIVRSKLRQVSSTPDERVYAEIGWRHVQRRKASKDVYLSRLKPDLLVRFSESSLAQVFVAFASASGK